MKAKKLLAGVLTCTMVFAMGMTAFAADGNVGAGMKKSYKLVNEGTVSPAETFKFTATCTGVSDAADGVTVNDAPQLTIGDAAYAAGAATGDGTETTLTITPAKAFPSVGIYTYQVNETVGNTAGVTYDTTKKTLVVTVTLEDGTLKETYALHDGDKKTDTVENTYSAGSLSVKKVVTGNLGDKNKKFEVTVTLKSGKTVNSTITYQNNKTITPDDWKDGEATVKVELKDQQTVTFANIPYEVTYNVVEGDYTGADKYEKPGYMFSDGNKKIDSTLDTVEITNHKDAGDIDTGINLTTLPYMLTIAAIFVIAAIAFVAKRRRFED